MSPARAPKGTYDLLPDAAATRDAIVATAARVFTAYGYRHIVTPEFEETELFERGVGEATDIVRKEMYTFADKGGRLLTLRPEGTAPVARAYIEHGMHKLPQPVKVWYYAPMFRYERPQAGRYREHYQIGAEAMGSAEPTVDAEVIAMLGQILAEVGVTDVRLAINSMGDRECRPAYVALLRTYLEAHAAELCDECRLRTQLNPLRTFDCKEPGCRVVMAGAPHIVDHLCSGCREHFTTVVDLLRQTGLDPQVDFTLVRGLDYYTRTTFEFQSDKLGFAQSTVGGGGRYDYLVEQLGGPPTPGVGFGCGLERLALARTAEDGLAGGPPVYVVSVTEAARNAAFMLAQRLRSPGFPGADLDQARRSVKGQLRQAARQGARVAVFVGREDLAADVVRVRDLRSGAEEDVPADRVAERILELLSGETVSED